MQRIKDKKMVYLVGFNTALGSFLFGYQAVNISSLQRLFANVNNLTHEQTSVYVSILTATIPFGAIIGSYLLLRFILKIRPRILMILLDFAAILSIGIQCISLSFFNLLIGRFMMGIIVGFNSGLVPKYIYGVTPKELSGSVGCLPRTMTAIGIAFGYGFGFLIDPKDIFNQNDWRMFIAFPILTCLLRSINLFIFLPYQIPTQKLTQKDIERLQKFYCQVYQNYKKGNLGDSRKSIQSNDNQDQNMNLVASRYDSKLYYAICTVLTFSNQLSGINAILFYAKQLFLKITNQNDVLSQMLVLFLGIIQMVSSFSGGLMMDRGNKKNFLIVGEIFMVICLLAIYKLEKFDIMVILLIFCHTIAYSFSVGPLHSYYSSKMLKNPGYLNTTNWVAQFLVVLCAKFMISDLGIGLMSLFFCICLSICVVILMIAMPKQVQNLCYLTSPLTTFDDQLNDQFQSPRKFKIQKQQLQLSTTDNDNKSIKYISNKSI